MDSNSTTEEGTNHGSSESTDDNKTTVWLGQQELTTGLKRNENVDCQDIPVINTDTESKWSKNAFGEALASADSAGKFNKAESSLVRQSIQDYCSRNGITPSQLVTSSESNKSLDIYKGAWVEISRALPNRSVQSIYRHGLRIMHPFKRGQWSAEETAELIDHVKKYGKKWSTIQGLINRSADACRDKYREFSCEYDKGRWKESETDQLLVCICECFKLDPSETDLNTLIQTVQHSEIKIQWNEISKKMKRRSRLGCFKRWKKISAPKDSKALRGSQKIVNNIKPSSTNSSVPELSTMRVEYSMVEKHELNHDSVMIETSNPVLEIDDEDHSHSFEHQVTQKDCDLVDTMDINHDHHNDGTEEDQAEMAARTVEAVDLPLVAMM